MASNGFCSVLEFGKLAWPDIEDFDTYLGKTNPQIAKTRQEEAEVKQMKDDMIAQITQNGITFEQYKEITGLDDEKINENFNVQARRRLEEYLVLLAVANTEKITLTDKDLEDYYANVAAQYGMEVEKVKEVFSKNVDRIRQNLIQDKIVRFLIDSNIAVKEENK